MEIEEKAVRGRGVRVAKRESEEDRRCEKTEGVVEIEDSKRHFESIFWAFAQLPQQSMLSTIRSKAAGYECGANKVPSALFIGRNYL